MSAAETITQLPIEQGTYEATFNFVLKDKDGFTLVEIPSATTHWNLASQYLSALQPSRYLLALASRTAQVISV